MALYAVFGGRWWRCMPFVVSWLCGAAGRVLRSLCDILPAALSVARGGSVWCGVVVSAPSLVPAVCAPSCVVSVAFVVSFSIGMTAAGCAASVVASSGSAGRIAGVVSVSSV